MAHDALPAYRSDVAAGKDAPLVCDTVEMCEAINRRLHDDSVDADAPTATAAPGHQAAVGDMILSRRDDPTVVILKAHENVPAEDPVRNGNRWRVIAVDTEQSDRRAPPRRWCPRRLQRRLPARRHQLRLCDHGSCQPGRHHVHHHQLVAGANPTKRQLTLRVSGALHSQGKRHAD
jgi:hypothetical protein